MLTDRRIYDYACLRYVAPSGEKRTAQMSGRKNLSLFFPSPVLGAEGQVRTYKRLGLILNCGDLRFRSLIYGI